MMPHLSRSPSVVIVQDKSSATTKKMFVRLSFRGPSLQEVRNTGLSGPAIIKPNGHIWRSLVPCCSVSTSRRCRLWEPMWAGSLAIPMRNSLPGGCRPGHTSHSFAGMRIMTPSDESLGCLVKRPWFDCARQQWHDMPCCLFGTQFSERRALPVCQS